jgi:hypothetical protein
MVVLSSVTFWCDECDNFVSIYSSGGESECEMYDIGSYDIPDSIIDDVSDTSVECDECGKQWVVSSRTVRVVEINEE